MLLIQYPAQGQVVLLLHSSKQNLLEMKNPFRPSRKELANRGSSDHRKSQHEGRISPSAKVMMVNQTSKRVHANCLLHNFFYQCEFFTDLPS